MKKSFVYVSGSGCFLPIVLFINLVFGWLVFKPLLWLTIEGVLLFLFAVTSYVFVSRASRFAAKKDTVVDVEAEVLEEKKKLP